MNTHDGDDTLPGLFFFLFIFIFGLNRPSALIFRKISVEVIRVRMTSQAEAICFLMILRMTEIS